MLSSGRVAVIPAQNEEPTIRTVIRKALKHVDTVIVVDDGSVDRTSAVARAAGAQVLRIPQKGGYGRALVAGLTVANARGFRCIATLDADGAHDPDDLDVMFARHISARNDLTIGDRFGSHYGAHEIPSPKRWANYFAAAIVNQTAGSRLVDVACGLRVMSARFVLELLLEPRQIGFGFAYELIHLACRGTNRLGSASVSVRYNARELHCTGRQELLDLLAVCLRKARGHFRSVLVTVRARVWRHRLVTCSVGGKVLVLVPLRERNAYVFQLQDDFFDDTNSLILDGLISRKNGK